MTYFLINNAPLEDEDYAFLEQTPEGTLAIDYKMATGEPMGKDYPERARITMDAAHPGIQLADLVGNSCGLLIVSRRVKEGIERVVTAPVEYLPVAIYNHKKRLASKDYFIINPLGTLDCLDLDRSEITWSDGEVVDVDVFVLDPKKLDGAPDLFRIKEDPRTYVMSKRLVKELVPLDPTNFLVDELAQ
jgi:hypothetical protein